MFTSLEHKGSRNAMSLDNTWFAAFGQSEATNRWNSEPKNGRRICDKVFILRDAQDWIRGGSVPPDPDWGSTLGLSNFEGFASLRMPALETAGENTGFSSCSKFARGNLFHPMVRYSPLKSSSSICHR